MPAARQRLRALQAQLAEATGAPVACVQTHISWVLLAGERAYKLKKPVRLSFVDFSSAQARWQAACTELRLNRRHAPALYLGLVPVHGEPAAPRLGLLMAEPPPGVCQGLPTEAEGAPPDVLVCMRRFPADALFSHALARGALQPRQIDRFGLQLARSHAAAPCAGDTEPWGYPPGVFGALRRVLAALRKAAQIPAGASGPAPRSTVLDTLDTWAADAEPRLAPLLAQRRSQGWVRECHGDLHLENLVLLDGVVLPFDAIEFDPALRWIDVASDLAFTTMDLRAHGRADLAARLLDAYLQASGDHGLLPLLRFYEVCRALVRALVACLRGGSGDEAGADSGSREGGSEGRNGGGVGDGGGGATDAPSPDYLNLAVRMAQESRETGRARLLLTCGLSGSGKSTLALALLQQTGAVRLRSDVERKRLAGLDALARSAPLGLNLYTPEATRRTFCRLAQLADGALAAGWPVIVDAASLRRAERRRLRALARLRGVPFTLLLCQADPALLPSRLAERAERGDDPSEADARVLALQTGHFEPCTPAELAVTWTVDTGVPVDAAALGRRWMRLITCRIDPQHRCSLRWQLSNT